MSTINITVRIRRKTIWRARMALSILVLALLALAWFLSNPARWVVIAVCAALTLGQIVWLFVTRQRKPSASG